MTIKPAAKRAPPDGENKIEGASGGGADAGNVSSGHRNVVLDAHGQSPRRELYEDHSRHRCSPNKNTRNKRREHLHDSLKRERSDRSESHNRPHSHPSVSGSSQGTVRSHGGHSVNLAVGGILLPNNNLNLGNSGNVVSSGVVVAGKNSPSLNDVVVPVTNHTNHTGLLAAAASVNSVNSGTKSPSSSSLLDSYLGPTSSSSSSSNSVVVDVSQADASEIVKDVEEKCSGYNSGDEYIPSKEKAVTSAEWKRRDEQFKRVMSELGYELRQVEEDGACLFRAISLQIYGDEDAHDIIRQHTMDYIYKNREYFSHFVTEDIDDYITRKRRKDSHGNHIEIQAMSEIYGRPVEVYCYKPKPINIFNSEQNRNGYPPLRLSYQRWSHYNAIIDPYNATVGVGLGIANYHPQMQTKDAVRLSEQMEIEQTMFEDKLKTTDWEATNEVIEEQVARESYLQWCRENMQRNRGVVPRPPTSTITSAQANDGNDGMNASFDEIASPSKYAMGGYNDIANMNDASGGVLHPVSPNSSAVRKVDFMGFNEQECKKNADNVASSACNSPNASSGKKSAQVGYSSDDSTNSSIGGNAAGSGTGVGNVKLGGGAQSPARSKKMKTRLNNSKKRRHDQVQRQKDKNDDDSSSYSSDGHESPKIGSCATNQKGAKRDTSNSLSPMHAAANASAEERPCSSKCAQQPPNVVVGGNGGTQRDVDDSANTKPFSTFYQDLLESSYTTDGYGQLTEAEMLQRAIQMSTQDYIEDQKRKYLYGP